MTIRLGSGGARRRRPNLIPMIDVMVLLLVFFMLASRFGGEYGMPVQAGAAGGAYAGPPRLVQVTQSDVALNGVPMADSALVRALGLLMANTGDLVVMRATAGVTVQRVVDVMGVLQAAGLQHVVLVE